MTKWTLEEGKEFASRLEAFLSPRYHVALTGSVLYKGSSLKDLDIIVFPNHYKTFDKEEIRRGLVEFGMILTHDRETVLKIWEADFHSDDRKWVEMWQYKGRRVDVFYMT